MAPPSEDNKPAQPAAAPPKPPAGPPAPPPPKNPGFVTALPHLTKDAMLADLVPTFDSINMIGGEVEQ